MRQIKLINGAPDRSRYKIEETITTHLYHQGFPFDFVKLLVLVKFT